MIEPSFVMKCIFWSCWNKARQNRVRDFPEYMAVDDIRNAANSIGGVNFSLKEIIGSLSKPQISYEGSPLFTLNFDTRLNLLGAELNHSAVADHRKWGY